MHNLLNFSIKIDVPSMVILEPKQQNIVNNIDYTGAMVGVYRNKEEDNSQLIKRIRDAFINQNGGTYNGVINSITRAFGFSQKECFTISLKTDINGDIIASNPRIDILANRIILYTSWKNNDDYIIDKEIFFYNKNSEGFYLDNLVASINTSSCFSCVIAPNIRPNSFSTSIIKDSTYRTVVSYIITEKRTKLPYDNIIDESLSLYDKVVYDKKVATEPSNPGEYYIDYKNGILISYLEPTEYSVVTYKANAFPFTVKYSPIQIFSLNDDNFRNELYNEEIDDAGNKINGLLNSEGAEIINEIYKTDKVFWGK